MNDADAMRSHLNRYRQLTAEAVSQGSGAVNDVQDALVYMKKAADLLKGSRTYAAEQLGKLVLLRYQLDSILHDSLNADALSAEGDIQNAVNKIQDYVNAIQFHINDLEEMSHVIQMNLKVPMLDDAGIDIRQSTEKIERWAQNI